MFTKKKVKLIYMAELLYKRSDIKWDNVNFWSRLETRYRNISLSSLNLGFDNKTGCNTPLRNDYPSRSTLPPHTYIHTHTHTHTQDRQRHAQRQIYKKEHGAFPIRLSSFRLEACRATGRDRMAIEADKAWLCRTGNRERFIFQENPFPLCHATETRETFNRSWGRVLLLDAVVFLLSNPSSWEMKDVLVVPLQYTQKTKQTNSASGRRRRLTLLTQHPYRTLAALFLHFLHTLFTVVLRPIWSDLDGYVDKNSVRTRALKDITSLASRLHELKKTKPSEISSKLLRNAAGNG